MLKSHPPLQELTQTRTQQGCSLLLTDEPCSADSPVAEAHTVHIQVSRYGRELALPLVSPCPLWPFSQCPLSPSSTLTPLLPFPFSPAPIHHSSLLPFPLVPSPFPLSPFLFLPLPIFLITLPFISPFLPSPFPPVPSPHLLFPLSIFPYALSPLPMPTQAQHRPHLSALSWAAPSPTFSPKLSPSRTDMGSCHHTISSLTGAPCLCFCPRSITAST